MTPGERKAYQALMGEELLRNTMLHDLRGNATALLGWQSLIEPRGQKAAGGMQRSVEALMGTIRQFSAPLKGAQGLGADLHRIAGDLGISIEGVATRLEVCPHRMEAALSLAQPTELRLSARPDDRVEVRILGLSPEGLALLGAPHSAKIVDAVSGASQVLGVCLFKEVVRGVRGEYDLSGDRSELRLVLSTVPETGI